MKGLVCAAAFVLHVLVAQQLPEGDAVLAGKLEAELAASRGRSSPREIGRGYSALGVVYHRLGRYADAEQAYRHAIASFRDGLGENDPELAGARSDLACLYIDMGRCAEATRLLDTALQVYRVVPREARRSLAPVLVNLAEAQRCRKDLQAAEATYSEATETLRCEGGGSVGLRSAILINLGILYRDQGRLDQALASVIEAVALLEHSVGPDDARAGTALYNLALVHTARKEYDAACSAFRRALEIAERSMGPYHPRTAVILWDMSALLDKTKRRREAKECRNRAREIQRLHQKDGPARETVDVSEFASTGRN